MKASDFVHLHCHSTFSLLEALPLPEEIVLRAKELEQTAVGLADKGYTYGLIDFYKSAKSAGVRPVLGLEVYIAARTRFDKESSVDTRRYPLVLLAETGEGYQNLLNLATKSALEGMYYKPRVDSELLKLYGKGLIALSGPISSAISQSALAEDFDRVKSLVDQYRSFFGSENLYLELNDLPAVPGQSEANQQLIRISKEFGVPLVATCNSHYCRRDDAEAHDVLLCIQKNDSVSDTGRFTMRDSDFSMRPFEEMEASFAHVPEALSNTRIIADRCNVEISFGKYRIPKFPTEQGKTEEAMLKEKCEEGLSEKYELKNRQTSKPVNHQTLIDRLNYELEVINKMGFAGYFLIVADFVAEARRRGITVGPGRGSAAGSLVSYVLGITTLDPIELGLLFERFLNPERISMPDIDIDFADTGRDEVLDYVRQKYGHDRVIQICTFGTLAARAAVKDVGRAYGVSFSEMNALAKLIPDRPGTMLKDAMATDELKQATASNETYQKIVEIALKLEGKARHVSVHACGVVITPEPAVRYTALQRAPKNEEIIITQYDAKPLESLGLLKMDFLGLKNLTIIQTALLIIERLHDEKIDISRIPTQDRQTFELLERGETTGVFQLESPGMRRYLKQLKPTTFDDITAMVSLYRPGPMEKIPDYIKCKHGEKEVTYLHPDLEPVLKSTYGVGIYQEQILEMARVFAGFSLGEADLLRRAIGKKIKKELDAQRDKFIRGAIKRNYPENLAVKIFDDVITPFANYGFNKSHGACYARIAYETAYLKAHYPTEFMAALLSSEEGDTDRISIEIEEARAMGINVLPPDINESLAHFTALPDGKIRFGLMAVKGVGESSIRQIIAIRDGADGSSRRPFETLEDFATRVPVKILNKKLLESLAKSGALDRLGERGVLVGQYEKIAEFSKSVGDVGVHQTDMFQSLGSGSAGSTITFAKIEPATAAQKLLWEKETLGLYVSSHPLAGLKKYISKKARLISSLSAGDSGRKVTLAGIVEQVKMLFTKKGESMAILTIEDPTGKMEVTFFPRVYAQYKDVLEKAESVLVVAGTVDIRMGQPQLKAEALKRVSLETMVARAKADGMFSEEEASHWQGTARRREAEESVETLTDEGETVTEKIENTEKTDASIYGPLAKWILAGMPTEEAVKKLRLKENPPEEEGSDSVTAMTTAGGLSIHTVTLPAYAPKEMLIEIKSIFETFPGSEKIQLKIGEKIIPVGLTVTMSPILEKRIGEAVKKYTKM
ncbi:DNA polymerase III subunit alpha [Candidatus Peribacteria bacterium RIFCSPLOWO2_01_FULL_51_18]|nr:MAG: DNA polymerase III subunit alpha [Candidatus Peribacteria bacterium RIFCSPHIGHO2_02_FULL_51_15]OGJ66705.1 MAG: DNA polymerase III subunit alpha [Candidatus Peribacteria bacterium RIFCSPLOWO2_01_FULL_51_18]